MGWPGAVACKVELKFVTKQALRHEGTVLQLESKQAVRSMPPLLLSALSTAGQSVTRLGYPKELDSLATDSPTGYMCSAGFFS